MIIMLHIHGMLCFALSAKVDHGLIFWYDGSCLNVLTNMTALVVRRKMLIRHTVSVCGLWERLWNMECNELLSNYGHGQAQMLINFVVTTSATKVAEQHPSIALQQQSHSC